LPVYETKLLENKQLRGTIPGKKNKTRKNDHAESEEESRSVGEGYTNSTCAKGGEARGTGEERTEQLQAPGSINAEDQETEGVPKAGSEREENRGRRRNIEKEARKTAKREKKIHSISSRTIPIEPADFGAQTGKRGADCKPRGEETLELKTFPMLKREGNKKAERNGIYCLKTSAREDR